MAKALMFFVTLMALYLMASSQGCNKRTCETRDGCNRYKCDDLDGIGGTCMPRELARNTSYCPNGFIPYGRRHWCKHYRKCKCCHWPVCRQGCDTDHGFCYENDYCYCYEGWTGPSCETRITTTTSTTTPTTTTTTTSTTTTPTTSTSTTTSTTTTPTTTPFCVPDPCENGGICTGHNECTCTGTGHYGDRCQYIDCKGASNCIDNNGICYAQNDPILKNSTACPSTNMGKPWCGKGSLRTCSCCYGA